MIGARVAAGATLSYKYRSTRALILLCLHSSKKKKKRKKKNRNNHLHIITKNGDLLCCGVFCENLFKLNLVKKVAQYLDLFPFSCVQTTIYLHVVSADYMYLIYCNPYYKSNYCLSPLDPTRYCVCILPGPS